MERWLINMNYDKREDEDDKDYLERKAPDVHSALNRVPLFYDTCEKLFNKRAVHWVEDDEIDLSLKIIFGCLQLEIEELQKKIKSIEDKYKIVKEGEKKWHIFAKEKDKIVFENETGGLVKIPCKLLDIIVNTKSFDGEIENAGSNVRFVKDRETISTIPKTLINQLRGIKILVMEVEEVAANKVEYKPEKEGEREVKEV